MVPSDETEPQSAAPIMSYDRKRQNRQKHPILRCGPRGRVLYPRPTQDRTRLNPTEIIPRVPISPHDPPRGMNRPMGGPNRKAGKNGPDLTHISAFKPLGGYPAILMPPLGWSRWTKWNCNRRP